MRSTVVVTIALVLSSSAAAPQAPAPRATPAASAALEKLHRRAAGLLSLAAENMSAQDHEAIAQDLTAAAAAVRSWAIAS